MIKKLQEFRDRIDILIILLKAKHGQISKSSKFSKKVVGDVAYYFQEIKPSTATDTSTLDAKMQELLAATHKYSSVNRYKVILKNLLLGLNEIEKQAIIAQPVPQHPMLHSDGLIIQTLKKIIPSAACSYEQALIDLGTTRQSWKGPATDFREALRETLDHLAPDNEVLKQPNYKPEPDTHGPTMRQKVRYILTNRGLSRTQAETSEHAISTIEETFGAFVRSVYSRSSVSTHTPTTRDEVLRIRDLVRIVMCELLAIQSN